MADPKTYDSVLKKCVFGVKDDIDRNIGGESINTYAHILINSRDVPKDACEHGHLKSNDSANLKGIIRKLYYIAPKSGIKGPGTVGKNHVIEDVFKLNVNMKQKLESPMEIPAVSAHGEGNVDLDELALNYIFVDSGRSVVNILGDAAGNLAYASPTNLIDSATVATTSMAAAFFHKPLVIASEPTLKRFGFKLTTGVKMLKKPPFSPFPPIQDVTIPESAEYLITFDISGGVLDIIPPLSNPMVMAFDNYHRQLKIPEYRDGIINILNPGNDIKNKYLRSLFDIERRGEGLTPKQKFLKYFLIEIKLLGDTNHCMFSREIIANNPFPVPQMLGGGGVPQVQLDNSPTPPTRDNIAFGTCDFDVVLRFILENVNVFYKSGACTKYYLGKKMNPIQRLIYMNENTLSLIREFKKDLDRGSTILYQNTDDDFSRRIRGEYIQGRPFNKEGMKGYIISLLAMYESILARLKALPITDEISAATAKVIDKCVFTTPVVTDPRIDTSVGWIPFGKFFDKANFTNVFYLHVTLSNIPIGLKETELNSIITAAAAGPGAVEELMEDPGRPQVVVAASLVGKRKIGQVEEVEVSLAKKAKARLNELKKQSRRKFISLEESKRQTRLVGGGGGGGSRRKQHGGAFSDSQMGDSKPGLITYIVLTEYRDILKFGLAVYLSFCNLEDTKNLQKFFYITQDEDTIHMLLDVLSSGRKISHMELTGEQRITKLEEEVEAEATEATPEPEPEMLEGGGAALPVTAAVAPAPEMLEGGGGAPVTAAAAAPETEEADFEINSFYDNLTFQACKYALQGVMYFKDTYNSGVSEFNKEKLDSLLRIIVAILDLEPKSITGILGGETVSAPEKEKYNLFESLRKGNILETDLTHSLKHHLSVSNSLFAESGKSYGKIVEELNTMLIEGPLESGSQIGGAMYTRVESGEDESKESKESKERKGIQILDLQNSNVSELLHVFSFYDNVLTLWGERRYVNIFDVIYDYCSDAADDEAAAKVAAGAEAAAAALLEKELESTAPPTGQSTARSTAPSTPKRPTKPQEGSVGTADPFMSPGGSTFGNGRSRSSSLGSLLNFSSTPTRLNRERQEFQKGEGKFGIIKTGRKYDNRRTRRNRKARNPTRKL